MPGRTSTISPALSSDTGISRSESPLSTIAVLGLKSSSFSTASLALPLLSSSRYLPTDMSVSIVPADSK